MSVRVRLTRVGSKKNAMWRVVVADQRSPRDGRFIEMIGHYNPQTEPSQIVIDRERLDHWLGLGAKPSDTVRKLMRAEDTPAAAVEAKSDQATTEATPEQATEATPEAPEATSEAAGGTAEASEATAGPDVAESSEGDTPAEAGGGDGAAAEPPDAKSG